MAHGSWKFDNKTIPGTVLILLGVLFLLGTIGLAGFMGRLIGALLFLGLAYLVYQEGRRRDNLVLRLVALPLAGLGLASLLPGAGGGALFLAAIGLAFAIVWRRDPARWWAVIVAGALGSTALVAALPGRAGAAAGGTVFLLGLAATFFALTRLNVKPQPWAIYPAAALAVLALVDLVGGRGGWLVPVVLIGGGIYLLYRDGRLGRIGRTGGSEPIVPPAPSAPPVTPTPAGPSAPQAPTTPQAPSAPPVPTTPQAPSAPPVPTTPPAPSAPPAPATPPAPSAPPAGPERPSPDLGVGSGGQMAPIAPEDAPTGDAAPLPPVDDERS